MSISLASVFICENDDPNSVKGHRAMRMSDCNKPVVLFYKMCFCLCIQCGLNCDFIAAKVEQ